MTAKDKATNKEQKIRIEASSELSESGIQQIVKDAEAHSEEDKQRREEIDRRNRVDSMTYGGGEELQRVGGPFLVAA